ncbi:MAG: rod-binding protein [bacterium]
MMDLSGASLTYLDTLRGPVSGEKSEDERAHEAALDFEQVLLAMLLKQMRATVMKSGLFGNNLASDFYQDMFFEEVAARMARSKPGTGIAEAVEKAIMRSGLSKEYRVPADNGIGVRAVLGAGAFPGRAFPRPAGER